MGRDNRDTDDAASEYYIDVVENSAAVGGTAFGDGDVADDDAFAACRSLPDPPRDS